MKINLGKTIVIALGGSVVHPDGIDTDLIVKFRQLIQRQVCRGVKFVLIIGGGQLCRNFLSAAKKVTRLSAREHDWLGIYATRLNAQYIRLIFGRLADPVLVEARGQITRLKYPVTVGGGWTPGWSTDFVATALAHDLGADTVIIAGKPDFVYNKDPHKFKGAKPYREMDWRAYHKVIPRKWVPGAHAPVDPVAARFAEKNKMTAVVMDGRNLKNLERLIAGKEFRGTIIN
ncbi:MAG: UMP kinase [Candidatus Liptonbacteria bacterium]|nr:UMP kinase [Candidatus Liptonbacteria bacterium]